MGVPPSCRPECAVNSDCQKSKACSNFKCYDPCPGSCGLSALCTVVNHAPICSCPLQFTGDPFIRCTPTRKKIEKLTFSSWLLLHEHCFKKNFIFLATPPAPIERPCEPSPCGPRAQCRVVNNQPSCSCLPEFIGAPPNCRPECVSNSECPSHLACINYKCKDPCPNSCGVNTDCRVNSHVPSCNCVDGYVGDPFVQCTEQISELSDYWYKIRFCFRK